MILRWMSLPVVLALVACGSEADSSKKPPASGGGSTAEQPAEKPVEQPAETPKAAAGATGNGSISGTVKLEGTAPKRGRLRVDADPKCAALHSEPPLSDVLVVDGENRVRWAFVYVKSGVSGTYPVPSNPVLLDQKGCMYDPHIFGVRVGQPIEFKNSDPTLHNVHGLPFANKEWNFAQQPGQKDSRTLSEPEHMIKIKCDVHPWMLAWGFVMSHPFFSVSGEDGKFEIKGLPPGKYTVEVLHEGYKSVTAEVEVGADEAKTVDLTIEDRKG